MNLYEINYAILRESTVKAFILADSVEGAVCTFSSVTPMFREKTKKMSIILVGSFDPIGKGPGVCKLVKPFGF